MGASSASPPRRQATTSASLKTSVTLSSAPSSFPRRASISQSASRRPPLPPLRRPSLPVSASPGQCRGVRLVRLFPLAGPCSCLAGVIFWTVLVLVFQGLALTFPLAGPCSLEDGISFGFSFSLA